MQTFCPICDRYVDGVHQHTDCPFCGKELANWQTPCKCRAKTKTSALMALIAQYRSCNTSEEAFALSEAIEAGIKRLESGESMMQYGVMRLAGMPYDEAVKRFPPIL